jgi:hypothetical protein
MAISACPIVGRQGLEVVEAPGWTTDDERSSSGFTAPAGPGSCAGSVTPRGETETTSAGSRTGTLNRAPPAIHIGNSSIATTTALHAAWRAAAVRMRSAHNTTAVAPAIKTVRTMNSSSRAFIGRLLSADRARTRQPVEILVAERFASTMPLTSSSTEPWQKRSMIWRTARAARLRGRSVAV